MVQYSYFVSLLIFGAAISSTESWADRIIHLPPCTMNAEYVMLSNPSNVTIKVDIQLSSTTGSGMTLVRDPAITCGQGATCSDTRHCENGPLLKAIAPGESLCVGVRLGGGSAGATSARSGVIGKITIRGDLGYLVGSFMCQVSPNDVNYILINDGNGI